MNRLILCIVLIVFNLLGCASTRIAPIGPDTYLLQQQGASGFVGNNSVRMDAYDAAVKYCNSLEKQFLVVSSTDTAGGAFKYPSTDLQFRCLDKNDKDLQRPNLTPAADQVIEIRKN